MRTSAPTAQRTMPKSLRRSFKMMAVRKRAWTGAGSPPVPLADTSSIGSGNVRRPAWSTHVPADALILKDLLSQH